MTLEDWRDTFFFTYGIILMGFVVAWSPSVPIWAVGLTIFGGFMLGKVFAVLIRA